MAQLAQVGTGPGNTDSGPKPRVRSRSWFFTFNNPDTSPTQMAQLLDLLEPKAYVYQLEKGELETPHYQGCVYVKNPIDMPKHVCKQIHWERCKDWKAAVKYCQKEESRLEGPWGFGVTLEKPLKIITELRPWQQMVKEIIDEEPEDRKIVWIWEPTGNTGKTQLAKWICKNYNAMYVSGKATDAKYAIAKWLKTKPLHVVIFGFPRSYEEYVSYGGMEELKDGIFFSSKYESEMSIYNPPHVLVFANFPPDESKMSADKWEIIDLRVWDQ